MQCFITVSQQFFSQKLKDFNLLIIFGHLLTLATIEHNFWHLCLCLVMLPDGVGRILLLIMQLILTLLGCQIKGALSRQHCSFYLKVSVSAI